jgi:D-lactate dehydrogenase
MDLKGEMMMKIIVYSVWGDQEKNVRKTAEKYGFSVTIERNILTEKNIHLAQGHHAVSVAGNCELTRDNLMKLKEYGIEYISSKTVGFEKVDIEACKELGIKFSNSSYSPDSVGEFSVMSILTLLRKLPESQAKLRRKDFTLAGLKGRELHNQTVGVIGTGRIGQSVIKCLSGFGCKILGYDVYENESLKDKIQYVSLEELLKNCDVITLHAPLMDSNYHMLDEKAFDMMKEDVVIINNARGELIDTEALVSALKSGKVAGAALDTIENEVGIFRFDFSEKELEHEYLNELLAMDNVQITAHHAFCTKQAELDMVDCALGSLKEFIETGDAKHAIC